MDYTDIDAYIERAIESIGEIKHLVETCGYADLLTDRKCRTKYIHLSNLLNTAIDNLETTRVVNTELSDKFETAIRG